LLVTFIIILISVNKYLQMLYTMLPYFFRFSCHSIFNPNSDGFSVLLLRFSDFHHHNIGFTLAPSRMRINDRSSSNFSCPKFVHMFPGHVVIVILKGRKSILHVSSYPPITKSGSTS